MENLSDSLYFLFVCFIFICFGLILLFIINVKEFKKLYKFVLIFLFIVVIIFVITKDSDLNYQVDKNVLKFYNSYVKQDISVPTDYIIVVGDSRMKYLSLDENVTLPVNMKFIAKPGAGFDWFVNTAIKELTLALDNKVENRFYSVVFNMGVNDLINYSSRKTVSEKYYEIYQDFALNYPDVMFYVMSINPINDYSYRNKDFPKVTNNKIIGTNKEIISLIDKNNVKNISYCDAFNNLTFGIYEGIHYDSQTNKKILNYMINDCVLKGL